MNASLRSSLSMAGALAARLARLTGTLTLATFLSCSESSTSLERVEFDGYRADADLHKVQVSAAKAAEVLQRGGRLLADYGSFQLIEVGSSALSSLSSTPLVQLRDEYNVIHLNAGPVDTATPHGMSLRGVALPASGKRFHLVQFAGPILPEWYSALEATGVQVVTYIPHNAYLVYGDARSLSRLQAFISSLRPVQWDGAYRDEYKLDPSVHSLETGVYSIQLLEDPDANKTTLELIDRLKVRDGRIQEALGYVNVVAHLGRLAVSQIALRPDVVSIQPYFMPIKLGEREDMIVSGNLTGTAPNGPGYMAWLASKGFTQAQFSASGFGVDLTDSGIDNGTQSPNHFGLYIDGDVLGTSRIVYNRIEGTPNPGSTPEGCDGHGNINAHIIGGFSDRAGAPFTDAEGYAHGLGVAPFVRIGSSVIFDPELFTSPIFENLQSKAYQDGMRISSNGWGANFNNYSTDSQRYDALVRDAQPAFSTFAAPGNQQMVIVFAAGKHYIGANNTVGYPGTGKNVFTVGASENVHPFGGPDQCGGEDISADSAMDVASFSGRGPTADGRSKPDILAPGTHVGGGVAQAPGQHANPPGYPLGLANSCFYGTEICGGPTSPFYPEGQEWYAASSGTSHAAPAVAGAAALLRQYFINQGMAPPSPAMTKAFLMSSARYMTGSGANDNLYSNNQGMGLLDLGMAFDGIQRLVVDEDPAYNLFTASGQTRIFNGSIADSSRPFRVTLAWTDAPGSTTGAAYKNNLDLTVTVGGGTYLGNVFAGSSSVTGGAADLVNNVESVFLPAGVTGPFTVTVTAANINSDGVPNTGTATDQDFALVVYNSCTDAPTAPPTGLTASTPGGNQIGLTWNAAGDATDYVIYRSLASGGPYAQVGTAIAPPYIDHDVSGGTTYFYVVRGRICGESGPSNEASGTATGVCTQPPSFAGLSSATNGAASTCTNNLSWAAATPACGGSITYSVYRSQVAGFTPAASNRIATDLTGATFADSLSLADHTPYYYVVRATEVSTATNEETNVVERSAVPTGVITPAVNYFDDFDSNRPPDASAYWIPTTLSGTDKTLNLTSDCHYHSATSSYRFGAAATTACGGTYPSGANALLKLGGDGTIPGVNGFHIPATPLDAQMTFRLWYRFESGFDGAYLVYSTTGAGGPYTTIPDVATPGQPYITTGAYDRALSSGGRAWTGASTGANGALKGVSVDLSALAGQAVWFGFRFTTDNSVYYEGLYLDDVGVQASSVGACTTIAAPPGPAARYLLTGLAPGVPANVPTTFNVTALDAFDQTATGYNGTASFASSDSQAVLPQNTTFVNGTANGIPITFKTPGSQSVTASNVGTPSIVGSASTTVTVAAPAGLVFQVQPSTATAGASVTPAVEVRVVDSFGNLVSTATNSVTLTIATNPGGGTLAGVKTVSAVGGIAVFANLSIDRAGTGYTLAASSTGLTGATSTAFDISAGPAVAYALSGLPASTPAGAEVTFVVIARDAQGNTATGYSGTATVTSSAPAAILPGNQTFVGGVASSIPLTFMTPGAWTVTVTDLAESALTTTGTISVTAFPQPTIAIVSPANGDVVDGQVAITAAGSVAPGTTLTQIALLVDGNVVGTGTASPTTAHWDTTKVPSGSLHTITATIADSAGNAVTSSPVTVTVKKRGCGCSATGERDASGVLAIVTAARQLLRWKRRRHRA